MLPIAAIPVAVVYLISERRAAFVGLLAATIMLFLVLFWRKRRVFWRTAPIVLIIVTLYTAAFWNSSGTLGFPAQAVKTIVAPGQLDEKDQTSDAYREAEKFDILTTIKSSQFLGIGFGQKFLRPVPLPEITAFELAAYTPHNSVLWIWMKTGLGGFVAMLFLFGSAMRIGARSLLETSDADESAVIFTLAASVLMYAVFAYVDIAWDVQNCVLLGVALAAIGNWSDLGRHEIVRSTELAATAAT